MPLFKDDDDKDKFLFFVQRYQKEFGYKVYTYCLMANHGHFIIDANGSDISKVMHGINQCYAQYLIIGINAGYIYSKTDSKAR